MSTEAIETLIENAFNISRDATATYIYHNLVRDQIISMSLDQNTQGQIAIQFWESGSSVVPEGQDIVQYVVTHLSLDKTNLTNYDIQLFFHKIGYEMATDIPIE